MSTKTDSLREHDKTQPRVRTLRIALEDGALERAARAGKDSFPIAISSEIPYLRSSFDDYFEVLDHSPQSIRMDRLKDGAALLFNHNRDFHLGLIDNPRIGPDRVLRGDARFAANALAQEKRQDVANGTLPWVSVSYRVYKQVLEKRNSAGPDTYRVIDWEPMEVSLVTVPADASVGVGRSDTSAEFPARAETSSCNLDRVDELEVQRLRLRVDLARRLV